MEFYGILGVNYDKTRNKKILYTNFRERHF